MEPEDPPRKNYAMKERSFDRVNPVPGSVPKEEVKAGPDPAHVDPNDVQSMLLQNRAIERHHGQDEVELKVPRMSRRKRDFWLLLVLGNMLVVALVALGSLNPMSVIFGLSAMVLLSLGLTWIMWFVMGDY